MLRLGLVLSAFAIFLTLALVASGAPATSGAAVVPPVVNADGVIKVTLSCASATPCTGTYHLDQLDGGAVHSFTVAPHAKKTFSSFIAGPLHAKAKALKGVSVTLTQPAADGTTETTTASYKLVQQAAAGNGGPSPTGGTGGGHDLANGKDGPNLAAGPPTRYQAVHDPRGDARSSFQLPELFDITLATAKRVGNAVVFSITSPQPLNMHDSYGNLTAPCIEIPFDVPTHYPIFLFGNGQLAGYTQHNWPKLVVRVRGTTISWTVSKKYLFKYGFLWRATGGCDVSHLADLAPNKGFKTFRWITVPKH